MPILYCYGYCSFVICFEIRTCEASSFVLLSEDCFGYLRSFGYLGSFEITYDFRMVFTFLEIVPLGFW